MLKRVIDEVIDLKEQRIDTLLNKIDETDARMRFVRFLITHPV